MRWLLVVLSLLICLIPRQVQALPKASDELIKHLESLGYSCKKDFSDSQGMVLASHERHLNFIFYEGGKGIVFNAIFNLKPEYKANPLPLLKKFNQLMEHEIWLPKLSMYENSDKALTLQMQAWIPDHYQALSFKDFIARWQQDTLSAGQALKEFMLEP